MKVTVYPLQSGFVSIDTGKLVRLEQGTKSFRDGLHDRSIGQPDLENVYDFEVDQLFEHFRKDEKEITSAAFRERVLEAAIRCFGHLDISQWVRMQVKALTVGVVHYRFLAETFEFVYRDVARKMEVYTYYRLLNSTSISQQWSSEDTSFIDPVVDIIKNGDSCDLTDLLACWTSNAYRTADLLITLHAIFGCRSGTYSAAPRTGVER